MKYYIKNHLGIYKKITEKTYNEIFKIDASLLLVKIDGLQKYLKKLDGLGQLNEMENKFDRE